MRVGRRKALKLGGAACAACLAGAGIIAYVRTRGYDVSAERAAKLVSLSPWELVFMEHVARRIVCPDRSGVVTADEVDVAGFVDRYMASMHDKVRSDLKKLFAYVEHLAPIRAGFGSRFTRLSAGDQDRVLSSLESSEEALIHGGFEGLKSLVFMGYYRDARTWSILGYEGPLVGR